MCLLLVVFGAGRGVDAADTTTPPRAPQTLEVWAHAGQQSERRVLRAQIRRFEASHPHVDVALTWIPEGSYNGQVQAAALAGRLPDVLELDGPYLASYAWQGHLRPMDALLPDRLRKELLPSILAQGTYRGHIYGVGTFDSGLGLWADRRKLQAIGARIPRGPGDAWSAEEFTQILRRLARRDPDGQVLDLKLNYTGEWFTYAFSPLIESAGGDLIDRHGNGRAEGVLDGPGAVSAMTTVQSWIEAGYVDPNLDDAAFARGRVALAWGGHWNYPAYHAALGKNLVLLPLPRFGKRMVTDQGSWQWGITRRTRDPKLAMAFLSFLLQPNEVLAMCSANGGVPATTAAIRRSVLYGPHGPLRLFVRQLREGYAEPRPRTPAYPVISSVFARAFLAIRHGADVYAALHRAAQRIDDEIAANHGYPPVGAQRR